MKLLYISSMVLGLVCAYTSAKAQTYLRVTADSVRIINGDNNLFSVSKNGNVFIKDTLKLNGILKFINIHNTSRFDSVLTVDALGNIKMISISDFISASKKLFVPYNQSLSNITGYYPRVNTDTMFNISFYYVNHNSIGLPQDSIFGGPLLTMSTFYNRSGKETSRENKILSSQIYIHMTDTANPMYVRVHGQYRSGDTTAKWTSWKHIPSMNFVAKHYIGGTCGDAKFNGSSAIFTIDYSAPFIPSKIIITPTSVGAANALLYVDKNTITSTSFQVKAAGSVISGTDNITFDYELIK